MASNSSQCARGQGTTEYIVILAVIIVIALVVVGVMSWMPGLSTGITEQQSRAYWQSAAPVAVVDWKFSTTASDATFSIRNMSTDKITITGIVIDGASAGIDSAGLAAGETRILSGSRACTGAGTTYQFDVNIEYDVNGGISGKKQIGHKPIVGVCQ